MRVRGNRIMYVAAPLVIALTGSADVLLSQRTNPPILMDGHTHHLMRAYWEGTDPWTVDVGPFDFARARAAGVNVVMDYLAPYSYEPYNGTVKQALRLLETAHRVAEANQDRMALALSGDDVRRIVASGKLAVILGTEAGFDQDGDIDVLRAMYRLGLRVVQFSSQRTTAYADAGAEAKQWNGINERGRALVREMNRLGILIDVVHASEEAQLHIIEESRAPVIASHVGLKGVCHCGDLSDRVLKAIAAKGGIVGLHGDPARFSARYVEWKRSHALPNPNPISLTDTVRYRPTLIRSPYDDHGEYLSQFDTEMQRRWRLLHATSWKEASGGAEFVPDTDAWAQGARYVIETVGADHVGIGLDFFQGHNVMKNFDASSYPRLVQALEKVASPGDVRKIAGENWLRVLNAAKVR